PAEPGLSSRDARFRMATSDRLGRSDTPIVAPRSARSNPSPHQDVPAGAAAAALAHGGRARKVYGGDHAPRGEAACSDGLWAPLSFGRPVSWAAARPDRPKKRGS